MLFTLKRCKLIFLSMIFLALMVRITNAGAIRGSVLDMDGSLIDERVRVAYSPNMWEWTENVFDNGEYELAGLAGGQYVLRASGDTEDTWLVEGYYPGVIDQYAAEWVFVPDDGELNDIDIRLYLGGRISGSVTPGEGGEFEANAVTAQIQTSENPFWWSTIRSFPLENPGDYASMPVPPGEYKIVYRTMAPDMHVDTYYGGTWDQWDAEILIVNLEEWTENIDAQLPVGGGVTGIVTGYGAPLPYSTVMTVVPGSSPISSQMPFTYQMTNDQGVYALYGLPEGECLVQFYPSNRAFIQEWYNNAYQVWNADPVPDRAGEMTEGIPTDRLSLKLFFSQAIFQRFYLTS